MTTALANTTLPQPRPSALAVMAGRFNVEPAKLLETLKNTAFKGATDSQMMSLCIVANEFGLNPFLKQIYAFPDKGGGIVPVVGVDGWVKICNDHPQFDGIDFEMHEQDGKLMAITAIIYRRDRTRPVRVTDWKVALFDEAPFRGVTPVLANAFRVEGVPYRWERGRLITPMTGGDGHE